MEHNMIYNRELAFLKVLQKESDDRPNDEPVYWNGRYLRDRICDYFHVEDATPFMNRLIDKGYLILHSIHDRDSMRNEYYLNEDKLVTHE
jgi:hypothetical protein